MAALTTADVTLPTQIVDGIVEKTKTAGTIPALSGQEPMRFGDVTIVTFDDELTAEFVEQSGAKSADDAKPGSVVAVPHKAVVNFRTSNEFVTANEDYQLGVLDKFEEKCARALGRALDLGAYYRINPRSGTSVAGWTNYLNTTERRVQVGANADLDFESAAGLVIGEGYRPTGVALDPSYAWTLSTARYSDGRKKFPELGLGVDVSAFQGLSASVSSTVSGKPIDGSGADNRLRAIIGNFQQGIRWGVQKAFPFRMLEFGDPDNTGRDLAGHNEVLFRAEVVYAWYVFVEQFAVIEARAASTLALTPSAVGVGASVPLVATVTNADASTAVVTASATDWSSATPAKVTVDANGVVTGVAAGTSVITAKYAGKTGTVTVTAS